MLGVTAVYTLENCQQAVRECLGADNRQSLGGVPQRFVGPGRFWPETQFFQGAEGMMTGEVEQAHRTPSLLKYFPTRNRDLLAKAGPYYRLKEQLIEQKLHTFRTNCLERDTSRVFAETEAGEKKWLLDCATNDYLGMSMHPQVIGAVVEAITRYGVGAQGASMLNGNTPVHLELERELSGFLGKGDVVLSSSGYASQIAVTQGLLRSTDVAFYDEYCHASLVDGMVLSGAAMYRYLHLDCDSLQQLLAGHRHEHRGAMILTDGVFSAEGTVAPIPSLVELANQYDAALLVDDAHGTGTLNQGRGCAAFDGIDIITGTLSKALGSAGGFIAASEEVIEYVRFFGRANCATTSVSVANAAASLQALKLLKVQPELVDRLNARVSCFRRRLCETTGVRTNDTPSPVIALICGHDETAYRAWRELLDQGVLCHALPFPVVPKGRARIRLRLHLGLSDADLDFALAALSQVSTYFREDSLACKHPVLKSP